MFRTSTTFRRLACGLAMALLLAAGLAAQAAEPRRYALLIGINQYNDPGLVPLGKAQNDAQDLKTALTRLGGYRQVVVMDGSLANNDPMQPTRAKVIERVEALADLVGPDDQVLFFFSGHGVNDAKTGDSYLLPMDVQAKDPVGSGLNLQRDILAKFSQAGVKNIVALVDACQKTVFKDKGMRPAGVDQVLKVSDAVVITATGAGKASYEDPKGANGLFTRGVLAGLQGEADANRDGVVSVAELEQYLPQAVAELAFGAGLSQKPAVFDPGTGARQPALVKLAAAASGGNGLPPAGGSSGAADTAGQAAAPTAKAQFVLLKLPEGVRADIRILDASGRELKVLSDTSGDSPKLEPGSYRIEAQDRLYQYYPWSQTITVGNTKQTISLDLKPNFGGLAVACEPADGVDVLVNGEKKGSVAGGTLKLERLKSGSYTVVFSKDLYETKSQQVLVEDGKTVSLAVKLAPNFFYLNLQAVAGKPATLYVDGQAKGSLPQSLQLPYRDVAVKVVPDDSRYREWSGMVSPKAKGGTEKPVVSFAPRTGTLSVTTNPASEAELLLTPAAGGSGQKIGTAPLDWDGLIGDYSLAATASLGGQKMAGSAKLTLREGQTTEIRLDLKADAPPAAIQSNQGPGASSGATLVWVPGGTFTMGDTAGGGDSDETKHQVSLSGFYMGQTEVTQAQWQKVMGSNPSEFKNGSDAAQRPVECVTWYEAVEFCNKLSQQEGKSPAYNIDGTKVTLNQGATGYRLPTEAQWEYAAKGGASTPVQTVKYAGSANLEEIAWTSSNSGNTTHPVAEKKPNALGLYDMTGNVWEWCQDWYGNYGTTAQSDPAGAASGTNRVLRGGRWSSSADIARLSNRYDNTPDYRSSGIGFRVVLPAVQK
jgi:formylglycine-generating enzyme required for sulfatase activity